MTSALLAFLLAQPVSKYDATEPTELRRARIETIALAITDVSNGDKGKAAFLAVQAVAESSLRLDVQECRCPVNQCDRGLARSIWQIHRAPQYPEVWASICGTDLDSQTIAARWVLRYYRAASLECSFASLGGANVSCGVKWARDRAAKVRRLESKL